MKFNIKPIISILCVIFGLPIYAQPMIRSIKNNTPFQFTLVKHNDISDCSPFNKGQVIHIEPYATFHQSLLLGSDKPGILLRPSAFYDKAHKKTYYFLGQDGQVDKEKLAQAFHAWKKSRSRTYKKSLEVWFAEWLCGDISLIHNHAEVFGYLLNVSIARIDNDHNYHTCMVDYSEGLFSRQIIDVSIEQKTGKGIVPYVKSFVGQGGLCQDGIIVSI